MPISGALRAFGKAIRSTNSAMLTILHEVYGYTVATKLKISTE
jgi:hypothetical protein